MDTQTEQIVRKICRMIDDSQIMPTERTLSAFLAVTLVGKRWDLASFGREKLGTLDIFDKSGDDQSLVNLLRSPNSRAYPEANLEKYDKSKEILPKSSEDVKKAMDILVELDRGIRKSDKEMKKKEKRDKICEENNWTVVWTEWFGKMLQDVTVIGGIDSKSICIIEVKTDWKVTSGGTQYFRQYLMLKYRLYQFQEKYWLFIHPEDGKHHINGQKEFSNYFKENENNDNPIIARSLSIPKLADVLLGS